MVHITENTQLIVELSIIMGNMACSVSIKINYNYVDSFCDSILYRYSFIIVDKKRGIIQGE